jgi:hypothetical protein
MEPSVFRTVPLAIAASTLLACGGDARKTTRVAPAASAPVASERSMISEDAGAPADAEPKKKVVAAPACVLEGKDVLGPQVGPPPFTPVEYMHVVIASDGTTRAHVDGRRLATVTTWPLDSILVVSSRPMPPASGVQVVGLALRAHDGVVTGEVATEDIELAKPIADIPCAELRLRTMGDPAVFPKGASKSVARRETAITDESGRTTRATLRRDAPVEVLQRRGDRVFVRFSHPLVVVEGWIPAASVRARGPQDPS